jgi:ankyrin repeat protein
VEAIFSAILKGDDALVQLLKRTPSAVQTVAAKDVLIESIHWLYVGDTGLHLAAAACRIEAARLLLDSGATIDALNRRGATALHYACDPRRHSSPVWSPAVQAELIALLVRHGADVDRGDKGGATPLHRAVRARSPEAVRALLEAGARVDSRLKKQGSLPLHLAVQSTGAGGTAGSTREQLEIVELLLRHGANPDAPDGVGRTARDWAGRATVADALDR